MPCARRGFFAKACGPRLFPPSIETGTLGLASEYAQSPSSGVVRNVSAPEVLCGSCCVFSTGTHRVAVQTSHLPSMRTMPFVAAGQSLVSWFLSVLVCTDRPGQERCVVSASDEHMVHQLPLRRGHIQIRLHVSQTLRSV